MNSKNRKFAIIRVDTNDGDYFESINEVTPEHALVLASVAKAIQSFEPYPYNMFAGHTYTHDHNFPTGELVRADLFELSAEQYYVEEKKLLSKEEYDVFMNLVPYSEYGFHTVEKIKILAVIGEIILL